MKYLIIKCEELGDQWECDADRIPICVIDNYSEYNKRGYEIYEINNDGSLKKIRDYDQVTSEYFVFCRYNNDDPDGTPLQIEYLKKGSRSNVTRADVKKWCKQFNFQESVETIYNEIKSWGGHGELVDENDWLVFGEAYDDIYPKGY